MDAWIVAGLTWAAVAASIVLWYALARSEELLGWLHARHLDEESDELRGAMRGLRWGLAVAVTLLGFLVGLAGVFLVFTRA